MIKVNKIVAGSDGSVTTTLIQEIPAKGEDAIYILNPTVKVDMGNAESMDFSLQAGTEFYDSFTQLTTYIQVIYDGTTIFYGRVLTIDDGAFGTRKVHCEGALSFLNDSFFPAKPEKARDNISIYEHISEVLSNHNNQLDDPLRSIYIGQVPGHYSSSISPDQMIDNASREFGSSSLVESKSMLEDLKSHYGGCFRIRYSGGKCYLDWMKHYFQSTVNEQSIEVGVNLIDIGSSTEVSNIFTAVIPIGKAEEAKEGEDKVYISYNGRNYMKVPEVANFYSDRKLNSGYHTAKDYKNAIKNYGLIFKTVDIQEGTTPEILLQKTAEWIKENYQGSIKSFSVKAIDMRMIGNSTQKILAGDRVLIRYITGTANKTKGKIVEDTITCISVTYDLFNPENNQYSFGIPANSLSKNYSTKGKTQQKVSNAATPTSASSFSDPTPTDPNEAWRQAVYAELKKHKTWYKSTSNQETGPEDRASVPNKQRIWHAHETMTDGKTNYEVWIPNAPHYITGQSVYANRVRGWDRDSKGRPLGHWLVGTEEQLTITFLRANFLFEYMKDEHGVDLTTDLSVTMPGTYTDEEGNTTFTTATPVVDPDTGQVVSETMAIFGQFNSETGTFEFTSPLEFGAFDPEHGIWNFLGSENSGYISQLIDGVYHYFQVDPDHPDKFIEVTNIRDLHIKQVNTEDFIGTMTTGGLIEENGRINTYKFGQEILKNQYEGGDIVVAHVDGDKLMLGSENTMWSYNVASRINGQWVQPYIYTYDPDTGKGERVYIQERAGTMSYRGYYDSDPNSNTFGEFILQETGSHGPHGERIISITGNGIWDDKNLALKGGIITGKVGDEYVSYIKSDRLVVGNAITELTVMDALVRSGVVSRNGQGTYDPNALVAQSVYAEDIFAINGRFNSIETNYLKTTSLSTAFSDLTDVVFNNGGKITMGGEWFCSPAFDKITLPAGRVYFTSTAGEHQSATTFSSTPYDFLKEIRVVKVNSYQYKLQYKKHGDSTNADEGWHDIPNSTFNGASLLSGSWSGGIFTVKNDPNNSNAVAVPPGTVSTTALHLELEGNPTASGKSVSQVVKVQWRDLNAEAARPGMGPQYSDTGFKDTVTINASLVYTSGHGAGYRKALSDKGIVVASNITSWPALRLAVDGDVTTSEKNVKQKVYVQYRDAIAEAAGQPAPYYTNSSISGTVTINATKVYNNGNLNGYSEASGKVKVNGISTVNTSHSISPGGSCSITVPYYNGSSSSPKGTLTHTVTASAGTPHYNAIGDLNFLRPPDGTVQKLTMSYTYQGVTYSAGTHWWFYENGDFGATYSGRLYTYYS